MQSDAAVVSPKTKCTISPIDLVGYDTSTGHLCCEVSGVDPSWDHLNPTPGYVLRGIPGIGRKGEDM